MSVAYVQIIYIYYVLGNYMQILGLSWHVIRVSWHWSQLTCDIFMYLYDKRGKFHVIFELRWI